MGLFKSRAPKSVWIVFMLVLFATGACTRPQSETKELPRVLGTDAERGNQ